MNRLLFRTTEFDDTLHCILSADDYRTWHLRRILKARVGDRFEAGILHSCQSGYFEVLQLRDNGSILGILSVQYSAKEPNCWQPLHIGLGLPRPPVLKRLLRDFAAAGIEQITLIQSDLCEGDYCKSHIWEELEQNLILGAEQGRINRLPQLYCSKRSGLTLREFLDLAENQRQKRSIKLANCIALEEHGQVRKFRHSDKKEPYIITLGPERGWTARELELFENYKFHLQSLGPVTLRTEMAAHLAIGLYLMETQMM